jgi:hypothetical protein
MKTKIIFTIAIMVLAFMAFADTVQVKISPGSDTVKRLELYLLDEDEQELYSETKTGEWDPGEHENFEVPYIHYLSTDTVRIVGKAGIGESVVESSPNYWGTLYITISVDDGMEPPPGGGIGNDPD